ncbi:alpha/beta fold hydrolase [Deinococcus humi]|uniref:Pimeloyl-ACP methyl ester carboxylesterase n=1 Tax=Deinococcus humi TaxID=662880 RepID=A0A7W8NDD2_9DEIO|nr:alpha/beta fold hydrolase [Deinococcus humi]MBB5361500.1 pimeloyl-ACP methyl ester carboxylesterase [Deinococcus humi]
MLLARLLLTSALLAACAPAPQLVRPSTPAVTTPSNAVLSRVFAVRVVRPSLVVPGTPPELNASITVRYGPTRPKTILLLMPGFLGGSGSFDRLARQIVALAPQTGVWTVDRRSNLLEPQAQIAAASPAQLAQIVRDGLPPRSRESVSFMRDWGLDVTLRDWRVAIKEARTLTPNVFIGGHSMGGSLTGLYAAYDFGGLPGSTGTASGGRGSDDVRGMVMLDGAPGLLSKQLLTRQDYLEGTEGVLGSLTGLNKLPEDPYVDAVYFGPRLASRAAAQARLAAAQPDALAPAGGLVNYPATNLAAAMVQLEQRYALLPFLTLKTGRATNAVEGNNLIAAVLGGKDSYWVAGQQDRNKPVGWQADPSASTDPRDFVRRFWTPLSDFSEWYFPNRLSLDLAAVRQGTRGTPFENELRVWHRVALPALGIVAADGVTQPGEYQQYAALTGADMTVKTLQGAAHLDITAARSDTVARWILEWMGRVEAQR